MPRKREGYEQINLQVETLFLEAVDRYMNKFKNRTGIRPQKTEVLRQSMQIGLDALKRALDE